MVYSKGSHTVYCHRYHVVFATKYRYDVLKGKLKVRIGKIIRQTCDELGVEIIKGVLSTDHVHMFIAVPPKHSLSDVMRRVKGRSSRRIQQEFPAIRKRYWGCHFWARTPNDRSVARSFHQPSGSKAGMPSENWP